MKARSVAARVGVTIILLVLPTGAWKREPAQFNPTSVMHGRETLLARPLVSPSGTLPLAQARFASGRGSTRRRADNKIPPH